MNINPHWLLGLLAYIFIEFCTIPQIIRLHQKKSADDIAFWYPMVLIFGVSLNLAYAYGVGDLIYFLGQVTTIALTSVIVGQIVWYRFLRK